MIDSIGGAEGDRTPGLRIANAALCQTELLPHFKVPKLFRYENFMLSSTDENTVSGFEFQVST